MRVLGVAAVLVVVAFSVCVVIHKAEVEEVGKTIHSIIEDKYKDSDTDVSNVHYPLYYSIPFAMSFDILPQTAAGSFQLAHPADHENCKYQSYQFDFSRDTNSGFIITISGDQVIKINFCIASRKTEQGSPPTAPDKPASLPEPPAGCRWDKDVLDCTHHGKRNDSTRLAGRGQLAPGIVEAARRSA